MPLRFPTQCYGDCKNEYYCTFPSFNTEAHFDIEHLNIKVFIMVFTFMICKFQHFLNTFKTMNLCFADYPYHVLRGLLFSHVQSLSF